MTFKSEVITNEEDIALFDSYEFINPTAPERYYSHLVSCYYKSPVTKPKHNEYNKMIFRSKVWAIDRERNAFLTSLGGRGVEDDVPEYYALVWNNNIIIFALHHGHKKNENGEDIRIRKIQKIFAPKFLEGNDDEITDLIKESMIGYSVGLTPIILEFEFRYKPEYILEGDDYKNLRIKHNTYQEKT